MRTRQLDPNLVHRLMALLRTRGWPRTMALRRAVAALLVLVAGGLAAWPAGARGSDDVPVLVAAHDLPSGHTLATPDVALRRLPPSARPSGSLAGSRDAVGQVLAGPVRAGEPITDVRLLGPADTALATGDPSASAVPVRLADADVADLLRPGTRVDVVTLDPDRQADPVLAQNARVLAVREGSGSPGATGPPDGPSGRGRLVVIALPRQAATRVAAASLGQPVTVTLR